MNNLIQEEKKTFVLKYFCFFAEKKKYDEILINPVVLLFLVILPFFSLLFFCDTDKLFILFFTLSPV